MKWPGEAIWLIILPKNQTETKKFHFPFSPCFSPLSWLQVLELPWDHCVLTKKSFWIVQVDFLDLIFHLKSLSDHSGKIPVLVKNQGTFYLKIVSNFKPEVGTYVHCMYIIHSAKINHWSLNVNIDCQYWLRTMRTKKLWRRNWILT